MCCAVLCKVAFACACVRVRARAYARACARACLHARARAAVVSIPRSKQTAQEATRLGLVAAETSTYLIKALQKFHNHKCAGIHDPLYVQAARWEWYNVSSTYLCFAPRKRHAPKAPSSSYFFKVYAEFSRGPRSDFWCPVSRLLLRTITWILNGKHVKRVAGIRA